MKITSFLIPKGVIEQRRDMSTTPGFSQLRAHSKGMPSLGKLTGGDPHLGLQPLTRITERDKKNGTGLCGIKR